jgi:receptor protein-tyrosine kinase
VVAVAVALAYSLQAQKQYTATAALVFNNTPLSQQIAGLQPVVNTAQQSQQDTNAQLLRLGDLAKKTATGVGSGLTKDAVANSMSISPQGDTTVVNVSSTLPSATLAAKVANTYATTFVNEQQNGNRRYYEGALATVEHQIAGLSPSEARGPQGLALENRAQSLATLAQLRTDTVQLAQAATVPTSPSSPRTLRNVVIAGLLGLLLGVALAAAVERFDQRIRDPEELERTYGLPLLGAVPEDAALRRDAGGVHPEAIAGPVADTFQSIRARLRYFNVDRDVRVLAIVSAQPGEGKTTIAHFLANASASVGARALLIETDLRRPTMAEQLGVERGPGLSDALIGARELDDVTQSVQSSTSGADRDAARTFDVIVAGGVPPNPAEMLESRAMLGLLDRARANYDFIVIDTPPLGSVSDALPFIRHVDGVAIVAAIARARRDVSKRLLQILTSADAPLLGVIANRLKTRSAAYVYGYGYGYGSRDSAVPSQSPASPASTNGHAALHPVKPSDIQHDR